MVSYIITQDSITLVEGTENYSINAEHKNFDEVKELIKESKFQEAIDKINNKLKLVTEYISESNSQITIRNNELFFGDKVLETSLANRMIEMKSEGFDIENLCRFLTNLYQNPSYRAVTELYGFLEASNLPITDDGHFLAYKRIRENYTDIHSGTFDNSVGQTCEMARNEVNENKDQTCSSGLHFAALSYMKEFGGENLSGDKVVILKINPADVVSIPTDYNNAKGRCCKYEVVGEHDSATIPAFNQSVVETEEAKHVSIPSIPDLFANLIASEEVEAACGCWADEGDICDQCGECDDCCDCSY